MWKVKVQKSIVTIVDSSLKREEFSFTLEFETSRELTTFIDAFNAHSNEEVIFVVWYEKGCATNEV